MKILRRPAVTTNGGYSKSHLFNLVDDGLFTRAVKLGSRLSGWPGYEADVINAAGVAGWNKTEIKRLVTGLHELRKDTPGMTDDEINAAVAKLVQRVRPAGSPAASGKAA